MNKEELKAPGLRSHSSPQPRHRPSRSCHFAEPELGFKEQKTSAKVRAAFDALGLDYETGWGITGVKARLAGKGHRRTVAVLGELDAIVCRNHPHM